METTHRTHICRLSNHSQVKEAFDTHAWSASKLWNVASYHAQQVWDDTGEIPDEAALKHELKDHRYRRTLVGLKREQLKALQETQQRYRRTLVGLKRKTRPSPRTTLRGYRRTLVGLKPADIVESDTTRLRYRRTLVGLKLR